MIHCTRSNGTRAVFGSVVNLLTSIVALAMLSGAAAAQPATSAAPIKIGIIGSGNIGSTLGTFWAKAGHQVLFSSRHPENLKQLVESVGAAVARGQRAKTRSRSVM